MDNNKIINGLQDLIIRLQDAEQGYKEIELATNNIAMKKWLSKYAQERHNMHRSLESQINLLGGTPKVKTSFLGDLHRMFIDIKINNVSFENEFDAIIDEINRGANVLMDDYQRVIDEIEMPENLRKQLMSQKALIKAELDQLNYLKKELNAVAVS